MPFQPAAAAGRDEAANGGARDQYTRRHGIHLAQAGLQAAVVVVAVRVGLRFVRIAGGRDRMADALRGSARQGMLRVHRAEAARVARCGTDAAALAHGAAATEHTLQGRHCSSCRSAASALRPSRSPRCSWRIESWCVLPTRPGAGEGGGILLARCSSPLAAGCAPPRQPLTALSPPLLPAPCTCTGPRAPPPNRAGAVAPVPQPAAATPARRRARCVRRPASQQLPIL